jgi:hypothetical protein
MIASYPCDDLGFPYNDVCFRAIDVAAPAPLVYHFLSRGRIAAGQRFMQSFRVVACVPGVHVTVVMRRRAPERLVADVAATYFLGSDPNGTRVIVKELIRYRRGLGGFIARLIYPFLDLVAMRRRLRTLAARAESEYD